MLCALLANNEQGYQFLAQTATQAWEPEFLECTQVQQTFRRAGYTKHYFNPFWQKETCLVCCPSFLNPKKSGEKGPRKKYAS